jgi:hypothetical protein
LANSRPAWDTKQDPVFYFCLKRGSPRLNDCSDEDNRGYLFHSICGDPPWGCTLNHLSTLGSQFGLWGEEAASPVWTKYHGGTWGTQHGVLGSEGLVLGLKENTEQKDKCGASRT